MRRGSLLSADSRSSRATDTETGRCVAVIYFPAVDVIRDHGQVPSAGRSSWNHWKRTPSGRVREQEPGLEEPGLEEPKAESVSFLSAQVQIAVETHEWTDDGLGEPFKPPLHDAIAIAAAGKFHSFRRVRGSLLQLNAPGRHHDDLRSRAKAEADRHGLDQPRRPANRPSRRWRVRRASSPATSDPTSPAKPSWATSAARLRVRLSFRAERPRAPTTR
jgi:hypothetical protein